MARGLTPGSSGPIAVTDAQPYHKDQKTDLLIKIAHSVLNSNGSTGGSGSTASATPYVVEERFKIFRSETGTAVAENIQTLADTLAGTAVQVVGYQIQLYQCDDETAAVSVQLPSSDAKLLTKTRRTTSKRASSKIELIETDVGITLAPTAVAGANEVHVNLEWTAL